MSSFLDRAKQVQVRAATTTDVWIKLDLLEGLIDEIEALRRIVQRTRPATEAEKAE